MAEKQKSIYKRIILKISGEAFHHEGQIKPYNQHAVESLAEEIDFVNKNGVEISVVVGGGNIVRGRDIDNIDKDDADKMGMMATVINTFYLQKVLERRKREKNENRNIRMQSAIYIEGIVPFRYMKEKTIHYLEGNNTVLFAGGIGQPRFSTDMATALRAFEIKPDAILKGTKVNGIYERYPPPATAQPIPEISYEQAQRLDLKDLFDNEIMNFLKKNKIYIPIHFFNTFEKRNKNPDKRNLWRILCGEKIGSVIMP